MDKYKKIKLINFSLKITIVALAFGFIYKQIFLKEDIYGILIVYRDILKQPQTKPLFFTVFVMMLANWGIEAVKWKFMIGKLEKISYRKAFKAILSGITVSFFTPNRIGEYLGRVFHLEKADKIKAVLVTIAGSISQLLATAVFGSISLLFYLANLHYFENYVLYIIACLVMSLVILMIFLFFNLSFIGYLFARFPFSKKILHYSRVFSYYSAKELFGIQLLSVFRYLIFTIQYYLLLKIMNVSIPFFPAFEMISLTFLVMSIIPTIALTDIGIRGSVSLFFIGLLSDNNIGIITASFSLWLINLVIPALIGSVFIFYLRFIGTEITKRS